MDGLMNVVPWMVLISRPKRPGTRASTPALRVKLAG
ncbi:hypothetical protein MicloDRAFT_00019080 [Microvirga lotononidis]|uniref:Uncharacterized protein n=1 Tax=Microvirga lotononidis TaxID=864069 RepID=I4YZN8_9HYPH|nr:hypothetical protein MicloDRAFT_00019080 [Microvirga lotononidis]